MSFDRHKTYTVVQQPSKTRCRTFPLAQKVPLYIFAGTSTICHLICCWFQPTTYLLLLLDFPLLEFHINGIMQYIVLLLLLFGCAMKHVGSYFPDQRSNPCPLQWKHGIFTSGKTPGHSLCGFYFFCSVEHFWASFMLVCVTVVCFFLLLSIFLCMNIPKCV